MLYGSSIGLSFRRMLEKMGENLTAGFIMLWDGDKPVDSPMEFDEPSNTIISTAAIQVPQGTIFVGEDVAVRNHGGFTSSTNLQIFNTKILVGRSYGGVATPSPVGLDGSEERVSVARFGKVQLDFPAQTVDNETKTISGTTEIAVVFTEILPAMIVAHSLRGTSGKATMRLDTAKTLADNNLSDEDFLALPDSALITIADGKTRGFTDDWDFDSPVKRDLTVDGNGTDYNTYEIPVDFDVGRKIKLVWLSADGNSVTFKGSTIGGLFFPYIITDFHLRTPEFLTLEEDADALQTTDGVFTEIFRHTPVDRTNLEYWVQGSEDGGLGSFSGKFSANILNNGGSANIIGGQDTITLNTSDASLRVRIVADSADVVIEVRGKAATTYDWTLQSQRRLY